MTREPARLRRFHAVSAVNIVVLGFLMLGSPSVAQASAPAGTEPAAAVDDWHAAYLARWVGTELGVAYEAVRSTTDQPAVSHSRIVDPRLAGVALDPMAIPPQALARQLGHDVAYDLRVEVAASGRASVISEAIFVGRRQGPTLPSVASHVTDVGAHQVVLESSLLAQLDAAQFVEDTTPVDVYIGFDPYVSVDASEWVDWLAARDAPTTRAGLLHHGESSRRSQLVAIFNAAATAFAESTDCQLVSPSIATNAGWFRCPQEDLLEIPLLPDIRDIAIDWPGRIRTSIEGDALRADTGAQLRLSLTPPSGASLQDGMTPLPASPNTRIRAALIDPDGYYRVDDHPAFDDPSGPSRVIAQYRTLLGVTSPHGTGGVPLGHGSRCISPFANILGGQHSSLHHSLWPARSYAAHGAHLVTYYASGADMAQAISHAVDPLGPVRPDIVQSSVGTVVHPGICANSDTWFADWRDAWDYAAANGALAVMPAGNNVARFNDECTANALATRDDILVVGGFGEGAINWDDEPLLGFPGTNMLLATNCGGTGDTCWRSAIGGAPLWFGFLVPEARARIDLVAASWMSLGPFAYVNGTFGYANSGAGTSIAAPAVAAGLVSLLDWAGEMGFGSFHNVGIKHVNALLMSDGPYPGQDERAENPGPGPTTSVVGMSRSWGAGRFKLRRFDSVGMNAPWAWGTGSFYLNHGQTIDIPIGGGPFSSAVDRWLGVAAWDEPNITPSDTTKRAARVTMRVVYTTPTNGQCPNPGGSGGSTLRTDSSYDTHKLIRIQSDAVSSLWNKCAWMRFSGVDVPIGGDGLPRRLVFRADYWENRSSPLHPQVE